MNGKHLITVLLLIFFLSFTTAGCVPESNLQEKYGEDSCYYYGLQFLENGETKKGEQLLKQAAKKASPFVARRAEEKLCTSGTRQEQLQKAINYHKKYNDKDSLLFTVRILYQKEDYTNVLRFTDKMDIITCDNEVAYYRLSALSIRNNPKFRDQFYDWCVKRPFTSWHYEMYCQSDWVPEAAAFRANVYRKNYARAASYAKILLEKDQNYYPQILSDAGKAFLYGSSEYAENAALLESLKFKLPENCRFYADFYAGRLYKKEGNYLTKARNLYAEAAAEAPDRDSQDNALWYYLDASLSSSIKEAITAVAKYNNVWHNADYFDDFFDTLSVRLLSQHLWTDYYKTACIIDGYASDETTAKYSYVAARLIDSGYVKLPDAKAECDRLYTRCLTSGTNVYYKFMAADRLGLSPEETETIIPPSSINRTFNRNTDAENYVLALIDFGFTDSVYEAANTYRDQLGMECTMKTASYLRDHATDENDGYTESLRLAARKVNNCEIPADLNALKLMYPRDYEKMVEESCSEYQLPEYLLYALIRSESFFDADVQSHAGASGLTQLMDATAGDIARKLKYAEYDLEDPATNIRFGAYYLSELEHRLDGSPILALFAYNGGITRVRSWVKNANLEFGVNSLPRDLFLESLPYEETREYGRKVLSAAAMYAYLYYDKTPSQIVQEIMH